jgi:PTH1 family peptidyl-tRNA hydrolase
MLIFYGLGNNEAKYLQTKHNVGRLVLESLAAKMEVTWQKQSAFSFAKTEVDDAPIYFLFSNGYMNVSGQPFQAFVKYYKLDLSAESSNLMVLQDDSDQQEGQVKLLPGGGSGGHKGIQSIYDHSVSLGLTADRVWRLKIGIRPPQNRQKSETFVLSRLSQTDEELISKLGAKIYELLPRFVAGELSKIQTELNTKAK